MSSFNDDESVYSRGSFDSDEQSFDIKDRSTGYMDTSKMELVINQPAAEIRQINDDFSIDI